VRWADLEADAPRLAERAHERLVRRGVLLVVTVRRDGTPRLSPVEPLVLDGDLWLSMMWQSRKAADLLADDRILVHSVVSGPDGGEGEIKVRGRAVRVDDPGLRLRYCDAVESLGWRPVEPYFNLFVVDIADVTYIRYEKSGRPACRSMAVASRVRAPSDVSDECRRARTGHRSVPEFVATAPRPGIVSADLTAGGPCRSSTPRSWEATPGTIAACGQP